MNKFAFSIKDKVLGEELSPANLTLPLLKEYSEQVMTFLRGSTRKDLASIKTGIEEGSLALVADNDTGILDDVIDDYAAVYAGDELGRVDPVRARIISYWQAEAKRHENREYRFWLEDTDDTEKKEVVISAETDYRIEADLWVDVELYLYGMVYDLGGKTSPNVHIELENGRTVKIESAANLLTDENRLYKRQLVRINAKKSLATGELRDEKLISFEKYTTEVDEDLIAKIQHKAKVAWSDVKDATNWVESLRGNSA